MVMKLHQICLCLLAATALLSAQNQSSLTIAVSDLTAQGILQSEAMVISEQLRAELMSDPRIKLVERSQMEEILREQGFQQVGCTNDACAVEIGQLLGVRTIIIGTVGRAGSYTLLSARALDVTSGQVVANHSVRTKGGMDKIIEQSVVSVSRQLLNQLFKDTAPPAQSTEPKKRSRTPKVLLIGGGVALLAGGATAAILLLKEDKPDVPQTNTEIVLP
jgi:hypothetical protein